MSLATRGQKIHVTKNIIYTSQGLNILLTQLQHQSTHIRNSLFDSYTTHKLKATPVFVLYNMKINLSHYYITPSNNMIHSLTFHRAHRIPSFTGSSHACTLFPIVPIHLGHPFHDTMKKREK